MRLLYQAWRDNDLQAFAIALGIAVAVMIVLALARFIVRRVLAAVARRTDMVLDDIGARVVAGTKLWLLVPVALNAGSSALELPARLETILSALALLGLVLQAGLWATHFISSWLETKTRARESTDGDTLTALSLLGFSARVVVWAVVLLVALDQMGFNITALVAGLGVGGVAVALAVQNILGDLFASLSIVLDKPFVVGDFIVVDSLRGTVERVGVKTTRLRSLDGELLVFSNADLLKSRIRNFKRMNDRRIAFTVGVTYETPPEKLSRIPLVLRAAVEASTRTRFDRAHFKEFGDSALVFEVVYFVLDPDFNTYMDIQQEINFAILEEFLRDGIAIAYPTRTLHVVGAPAAA
ncbi:MAG: mechanosensitive ion channel family protein [Lysobacter sp.]|nr:mechanosensitive ion channel family protein [Lysobacter sp.]